MDAVQTSSFCFVFSAECKVLRQALDENPAAGGAADDDIRGKGDPPASPPAGRGGSGTSPARTRADQLKMKSLELKNKEEAAKVTKPTLRLKLRELLPVGSRRSAFVQGHVMSEYLRGEPSEDVETTPLSEERSPRQPHNFGRVRRRPIHKIGWWKRATIVHVAWSTSLSCFSLYGPI